MSDAALREAERRWKASRSQADEEALLLLRLRHGALTPAALRTAAIAGSAAAAAVSGVGRQASLLLRAGDEYGARDALWTRLGKVACLIVALALARRLESVWSAEARAGACARDCVEIAEAACKDPLDRRAREAASGAAWAADSTLRALWPLRTERPPAARALEAAVEVARMAGLLSGNAPFLLRSVAWRVSCELASVPLQASEQEVVRVEAADLEVERLARVALVAWALGPEHALSAS